MRKLTVGLISLSLVAACGSDGRVAQPIDDFLDKVEAECRTASKGIDKLNFDVLEAGEVDKAVDLLASAVDAFKDLEAPAELSKDFDNLIGSIDDQVSEGTKLSRAIDDGDSGATEAAVASLTDFATTADEAADSLGALRCKTLTPTDLAATLDTIPIDTTPIDTTPIDTTPIDTTPTTDPEIFADDLYLSAVAPPGYVWLEDYEQSDIFPLYDKSILGPLITSYSAGRAENIADGHTASIFVITISTEWTDDAIAQYLFWEGVEDGVDVVTPAGFQVRQQLEAFTDTDCLAYYSGTEGIALCTFTGIDGLPIFDAFVAANP